MKVNIFGVFEPLTPPAAWPAGPRQLFSRLPRANSRRHPPHPSQQPSRRIGQCGQGFGGERPAKQLGANLVPFTTYAAKCFAFRARSASTEERRRRLLPAAHCDPNLLECFATSPSMALGVDRRRVGSRWAVPTERRLSQPESRKEPQMSSWTEATGVLKQFHPRKVQRLEKPKHPQST